MYQKLKHVIKPLIPKTIFGHIVNYYHLFEAVLANIRYGFPAKNLKVIGVTGTNGKTTTSFMIHKILSGAGIKTGLMTTVAYGINDDIKPQVVHMTTVDPFTLMKRLAWMKKEGAEYVVLEVTSHALAQNRIWGIPISIAVMTNLTHEHLDYHKTFENYRTAKLKLFKLANKNNRGLQLGIINRDDKNFEFFENHIKNSQSYGLKQADILATDLKLASNESKFRVKTDSGEYDMICHLPGKFNVYNALAAIGVARSLGLDKTQIESGLSALRVVEGRMTKIDVGQNFTVIVDFAHTPDSFEKLLSEIKPTVSGKLLVMFGSAGRRDESKRAIQGEIAGKYADTVILTEEDDRDIDGQKILNQIADGAIKSGRVIDKDLFLVHYREEAIAFALDSAKSGDTVMLLGKGHEKTIERSGGEEPWNEIELATSILKKRKS